jgi:lipopolysaccharide/colanic/teichoic acid biosynthesis glycosyltransferase
MRWLSRVGLDEIPQILNILRGAMGLFGARPLVSRDWNRLTPRQRQLRMRSRPGLIGPCAMLRVGKNEDSLVKATDAFLILLHRKQKGMRLHLIQFKLFVIFATVMAIANGKVR